MTRQASSGGPVMRLFQVKVKAGKAAELLSKFATTSAEVVKDEPGNAGYFFGKEISADGNRLIFASFWKDMQAVRERFGEDWQHSFLPEGYENLIEEHSLHHLDLTGGWFVQTEL